MPIEAPKPHLYHSINLEVAKLKLGHGGRKATNADLNLVAYIDMMTMLVIFLLMSFSATGEILFVQKNITLPDAQNWSDLERAPVIGVTKDVVTLDGRQVATGEDLMKDSATGDMKITELHDELVTAKNNYKLLHPSEDFKGVCIIQSDKNVEFKMLRKVMFSAAAAGYQNVNFAVRPKAKGGAAPAAAE
jgi:biopolymer transport protein ExbD